jgi:hypothetical protein
MLFLCTFARHTDHYTLYFSQNPGCSKFRAFSHPLFTAEIPERLQENLCQFYGRKIDTGTRFYPSA